MPVSEISISEIIRIKYIFQHSVFVREREKEQNPQTTPKQAIERRWAAMGRTQGSWIQPRITSRGAYLRAPQDVRAAMTEFRQCRGQQAAEMMRPH